MSRRRRAVKREILPDAKFGDVVRPLPLRVAELVVIV